MSKKLYHLKGERVAAGLTQADMAAVIGKAVDTYRKKENGQSQFHLSDVISICKKLNMSADYLFM
jgi:DNA-binding XRE family transcriptional regulator